MQFVVVRGDAVDATGAMIFPAVLCGAGTMFVDGGSELEKGRLRQQGAIRPEAIRRCIDYAVVIWPLKIHDVFLIEVAERFFRERLQDTMAHD